MEMHRAKPKEDVMKLFSDELDNTSDSDLFSIKRKSDELDVDNELTDLSSISGSSESEDDNNS